MKRSVAFLAACACTCEGFVAPPLPPNAHNAFERRIRPESSSLYAKKESLLPQLPQFLTNAAAAAALLFAATTLPAFAENELASKYGGSLDTSLVDSTCLVDHCSLQAKSCLVDNASCRKGLTCTAKCLGDASCITGCMARYGGPDLDQLLKCTIEEHDCIQVAILPPGGHERGQEPPAPMPVVQKFDPSTLTGEWYKVLGYNPNYDCYACQRNSFEKARDDALSMQVEFSMPHLLMDDRTIGFNKYRTSETMVFDAPSSDEYQRTAHSEGEMFGLKFWENWYIVGENAPDAKEEFKVIFYNGKTRQNTYEGAFVYARSPDLSDESMLQIQAICEKANMNPKQFCRIDNRASSCMVEDERPPVSQPTTFRGILASTKVSELLGVEPVAAEDIGMMTSVSSPRPWWKEIGDYLENPHRHFAVMDSLRQPVEWPQR